MAANEGMVLSLGVRLQGLYRRFDFECWGRASMLGVNQGGTSLSNQGWLL